MSKIINTVQGMIRTTNLAAETSSRRLSVVAGRLVISGVSDAKNAADHGMFVLLLAVPSTRFSGCPVISRAERFQVR